MDLANKLSFKDATPKSYKFGVVLAKKHQIISIGVNKPYHTHSKSAGYRFGSVHAEIDALIGVAPENIRGSTIYVFRNSRAGKPGISKPCHRCEQILRECGVKEVFYLNRVAEIKRMVL